MGREAGYAPEGWETRRTMLTISKRQDYGENSDQWPLDELSKVAGADNNAGVGEYAAGKEGQRASPGSAAQETSPAKTDNR